MVAVPESPMVCGESGPVSVAAMPAVAVPAAVGLKATDSVQLAPTASVFTQVLPLRKKDPGSSPINTYEVTLIAVVPVLITVTTCDAEVEPTLVEGNVKDPGESENVVVPPVPISVTVCGEPTAQLVATRLAVRGPPDVGWKATDRVQLAPAANVVPQVFPLSRNVVGLAPVKRYDSIAAVFAPVLVTVMVCAGATEPTAVVANVRLLGESVRVVVVPVPVRVTICGEPVAMSIATRLAVTVPPAKGRKAIDTVHVVLAANEVRQVFPVSRNELALAPVMV
jgi:hypothetical protein